MKTIILTVLFKAALLTFLFGQDRAQQKVFTDDIDNFWMAYDSIKATPDSTKQWRLINSLYIDKGSEGLKAFMKARTYSAELWIKQIKVYPKFWNSIRSNTLSVKSKAREIDSSIVIFKKLYPGLKDAKIYFTIGGLRSGGTIAGNLVLIGTEIAAGNASTDVSEFPDKWLEGVFREQDLEHIVDLNIHEYVHTQQKGEGSDLLTQSIAEGSSDFIAELVTGRPVRSNYITYGKEHEGELKEKFKLDMFTTAYGNWLYNGSYAKTVADLGYFMGYQICRSYYTQTKNKSAAIQRIIELDYSDSNAAETFLKESNYYDESINKAELIRNFEAMQPVVVSVAPAANGDTLVDPSIKELKIFFSKPMQNAYSINFGVSGKEGYPIVGINGFSEDKKSLSVKTELKPRHEYEFILTDRSFASSDGYPLRTYVVRFRTK